MRLITADLKDLKDLKDIQKVKEHDTESRVAEDTR